MNRREFLSVVGAAAAGGAVAPHIGGAAKASEVPVQRPARGRLAVMSVGCQRYGAESEDVLSYYARLGVRRISAMPGGRDRYTVKGIAAMRKRAESFGITVSMGRISLRSARPDKAKCNVLLDRGQGRDHVIREICDRIRACGDAGLNVTHH